MRILPFVMAVVMGSMVILFTGDCSFDCNPDTGCSVGVGGDPTPAPFQYTSAVANADFNDQTVINTSNCFNPPNTQFGTFHRTSNYQPSDSVMYYYFQKANANAYMHVDSSQVDSNMHQYNTGAIQTWANALQADVLNTSSYYDLIPQEETVRDTTAPIQEFSHPDSPPYPGGTAYLVNAPYTYVTMAQIDFYDGSLPPNGSQRYLVALHEMGHGQLLKHSGYIASTMFPGVDASNNIDPLCFSFNFANPGQSTRPPHADTALLEQHYDPYWNTDPSGDGGGGGCNPRCLQSSRRKSGGVRYVRVSKEQWEALSAAGHWIHIDDHLGIKQFLTKDGLTFASSLVIEGVPERIVRYVPDMNYRFAVKAVKVLRVLRNAYGPSSSVNPGDTVYFGDQEMADGAPWYDDPPAPIGQPTVLFLRPPSHKALLGTGIYQLTAPWVSKWPLNSQNRVQIMAADSRIKQENQGQSLDSLDGGGPHASSTQRSATSMRQTQRISMLLIERGVSSPADLSRYEQSFTRRPSQLLIDAAKFDRARSVTRRSSSRRF